MVGVMSPLQIHFAVRDSLRSRRIPVAIKTQLQWVLDSGHG